ncbi:MAG: hypothetical protein K0R43_465 [Pseudoduganella sp.]|nr:hypothetical protein [Pseudoduganella sp.]
MTTLPFPIRKECPPGACDCERDALLGDPQADLRILRLTKEEEKRLLERIEAIASYSELMRVGQRLDQIQLSQQRGLCRKTRQAVPAAVRRCLERHPEIAYAILDAHDLFAGS